MTDKNLIQAKSEELNEITRPFAERMMDASVKAALQGKKV
jgi:molecular chaperone HscA